MNHRAIAATAAAMMLSCAAPAPGEPRLPAAPAQEQRAGERLALEEYLPAPGVRFVAQLRPRQLVEDEELMEDWSSIFQQRRLHALQAASGFDPTRVEELWIASYDLGTLYLFDARLVGPAMEKSFRERALTSNEKPTKVHDLVHVTGMMNQTPHALVHLERHFVAIAEGDVTLAKIVAAYAEGRLRKSPSALHLQFVEPLRAFHPEAPLRAFLVGPFDHATDVVVQGLAAGALSIEHREGTLSAHAVGLGLWPQTEDRDQRLSLWVRQLFSTREFRALGLGFPVELSPVDCAPPPSQHHLTQCAAQGTWHSSRIAAAVSRLTTGSLAELTEETAPEGWSPLAEDGSTQLPESAHDSAQGPEPAPVPVPPP